jgi:predicted nicotinamide N-methyase
MRATTLVTSRKQADKLTARSMVQEPMATAGLGLQWVELTALPVSPEVEQADRRIGLWVPDDPDALIEQTSQQDFDERNSPMPYFSLLWPPGEALARYLLAGPRLDGRRSLDLGCGLGACGLAAARRGARVTFFDWEERAIQIVAASAAHQGLQAEALIVGDWRSPAPTLGAFDLILGADLLYQERNAPAVASFVAGHLAAKGEALIADPGRRHAGPFLELAHGHGLDVAGTVALPSMPHHPRIYALQIRRRR